MRNMRQGSMRPPILHIFFLVFYFISLLVRTVLFQFIEPSSWGIEMHLDVRERAEQCHCHSAFHQKVVGFVFYELVANHPSSWLLAWRGLIQFFARKMVDSRPDWMAQSRFIEIFLSSSAYKTSNWTSRVYTPSYNIMIQWWERHYVHTRVSAGFAATLRGSTAKMHEHL